MSDNSSSGIIVSYIAIVVSVGTAILGIINHKRVRSRCCGKMAEASFDVDNTTPPTSIKTLPQIPDNT